MLIIYDGDAAGPEGALKTAELLVDEGIRVWIAELPEGMDPAKILQERTGSMQMKACIDT